MHWEQMGSVFWSFQGLEKECIGNKWVKCFLFPNQMILGWMKDRNTKSFIFYTLYIALRLTLFLCCFKPNLFWFILLALLQSFCFIKNVVSNTTITFVYINVYICCERIYLPETQLEFSKISKMELFAKIINSWNPLLVDEGFQTPPCLKNNYF